jgi:acyl-coenzyme A thioesterase PaaI-like protein
LSGAIDDRFGFTPDPDNPGWLVRPASDTDRFVDIFGTMRVRVEADGKARCRVDLQPRHLNIIDTVHGGFLLALIDQMLFVGPALLGISGAAGGMTLDLASQFFGAVTIGKPLDIVIEILRETGRFVFVRGLIEQDGVAAVAFTGKILKARPYG